MELEKEDKTKLKELISEVNHDGENIYYDSDISIGTVLNDCKKGDIAHVDISGSGIYTHKGMKKWEKVS